MDVRDLFRFNPFSREKDAVSVVWYFITKDEIDQGCNSQTTIFIYNLFIEYHMIDF